MNLEDMLKEHEADRKFWEVDARLGAVIAFIAGTIFGIVLTVFLFL